MVTELNRYYQNDPYAYESKKDTYKQERDDARQELYDMIASNDKKTDVIKELVAHLNKLTEDLEREKHLANRVQTEADNNENSLGRQVTDDEIRSQFDTLLASIKTWSSNFTGGDTEISLDDKNADAYVHVAPHYLPHDFPGLSGMVASHKKKRRLFVRGVACYSMSLLFRTLDADTRFHGEQTDSWLDDESAKSFGDIEGKLHAAANTDAFQRKFHNWRALTAELLSQANRPGTGSSTDDTQKNLRRLAQKVIQVFKSWAINPTPDILIELEVTLYNNAPRGPSSFLRGTPFKAKRVSGK